MAPQIVGGAIAIQVNDTPQSQRLTALHERDAAFLDG